MSFLWGFLQCIGIILCIASLAASAAVLITLSLPYPVLP